MWPLATGRDVSATRSRTRIGGPAADRSVSDRRVRTRYRVAPGKTRNHSGDRHLQNDSADSGSDHNGESWRADSHDYYRTKRGFRGSDRRRDGAFFRGNRWRGRVRPSRDVCNRCGAVGHWVRDCPHPPPTDDNTMQPSFRRLNAKDGGETYLEAQIDGRLTYCLLDSGCFQHDVLHLLS